MHQSPSRDELRPADTVDYASPVSLLRLRRRDREVIPPEACLLGPDCEVCRWRREGLLDPQPETRAA